MNELTIVESYRRNDSKLKNLASANGSVFLEDLITNELLTIRLDSINLTCDKVLSAALRQLLDEILFPLRLSSFRRKLLFHPQAPLASANCSIHSSGLLILADIRFHWIIDAAEEPEPGAHANREPLGC